MANLWAQSRLQNDATNPPPTMPSSVWAQLDPQAAALQAALPDKRPSVWATPSAPAQPTVALAKAAPTPEEQQIARDQQKLQKIEWQQDNPWGTANNHPGKLGKTAHVFSDLGNIAGDIFAPHTMALIPGTQLNREVQEGDISKRLNLERAAQSENAYRGAETGKTEEETREAPGKTQSAEALQGAQAGEAQARAFALENPQAGTPELDTYRRLVKMGMPSAEALDQVESAKQLALAPKNMEAKTLDVPGRGQVAGKVDSQGNLLLADGMPAPAGTKLYQQPNYGQLVLPTKTATFIDPTTGIPTEFQWNEQSQAYDKPLGISASNAYGHEAAQAGAVTRAAQGLIGEIQAHRDKLGNPEAIIQSAILGTPWADPETAGLRAQIATFAALQPSMHGFRGQQAMEQFQRILGGIPNNPDALIASIQGITRTAGAINPGLQNGSGTAPKRPANVPASYHFDAKGPKGSGWYK